MGNALELHQSITLREAAHTRAKGKDTASLHGLPIYVVTFSAT